MPTIDPAGLHLDLSPAARQARGQFRAFAEAELVPHVERWDREERIPDDLPRRLAEHGYLGANIAPEHGGAGLDMVTYGLLTEEIGRACQSVRSLLTVHDMVAHALQRWGRPALRQRWLPALARAETVAAFALSEPAIGSDAAGVETAADCDSDTDGYVLNGCKKWTTFGQIAGVFLVFARTALGPAAFLVERDRPGVEVVPLQGMLGTRASMLAEIHFDRCRVPGENLIGRAGFGVSHVLAAAMEHGRYSVAWGAVGLAQACLEASQEYARTRIQFGVPLVEHQLVRALLSEMITHVRAGRLLCCRAGYLRHAGSPTAGAEIMVAKHFCAQAASRIAADAVQIHGAAGCAEGSAVARFYRDAKILEIIEGSNQIQQSSICRFHFDEI